MKKIILFITVLLVSFNGYSQNEGIEIVPWHAKTKVVYLENVYSQASIHDVINIEQTTTVRHKVHKQNTTTTVKHYRNSNGHTVQSPTYYNSVPAGATAQCNDGSYSFSEHRRGTCSHHGGVRRWLK